MRCDKYILAGWIVYLVALIVPWTETLGGGGLGGWFWQFLDLPLFIFFITFEQVGLKEFAGSLAIVAGIIMWLSPLFCRWLMKGKSGGYRYLPLLAVVFAVVASGLKFYLVVAEASTSMTGYVAGHCLWVLSFVLLATGFFRQMAYIKHNVLKA